ncbi:MAG: hypothetical protein WED15_09070 [Akkermansiaceae bacterium]
MTRTQIQLPDELYQRAKAFAAERELSLAEVTRRGLELFLDRFPNAEPAHRTWKLPRTDAGGIKVPLESLRDFAADDESKRSLPDP